MIKKTTKEQKEAKHKLERKLAKQQMQQDRLEEREDGLQQTKDQNMRLEERRHKMARLLWDLKADQLDKCEQKQITADTKMEETAKDLGTTTKNRCGNNSGLQQLQ